MNNTGRMDICCFPKYGVLFVCCLYTMESFINGSPCQPDFFFDVVTDSCGPCSDMCAQAEQKGSVSQCREACPAFFSTLETSTELPHIATSPQSRDKNIQNIATIPATTAKSHNATSPRIQDKNIRNTALTTIVVSIVLCTFALIIVVSLSVYCIRKRVRPDTRLPLVSIETNKANEQAGQQPVEHDVNSKLVVTGAQNSNILEPGDIEAQTQRKEL